MSNILDVLRVEKKYRVSLVSATRIMNQLAAVLPADRHNNGNQGYMVRSVYFDTLDNSDFFEKEDGVDYRKKIRLRVYNPEDSTAKLEMKEKKGIYQRKRSLTVSKEHALQMIQGNFSFLNSYEADLAKELYFLLHKSAYMPRSMVQYQRAAFTLPTNDIRITMDMYLKSSEFEFDLFSPSPMLFPIGMFDDVTMEVKYNHFLLSYIRDLLDRCDKAPVAYSKYCMSRAGYAQ